MSIKDLPSNLRPREKAFLHGVDSLSDIELLALFLTSGTKSADVLHLAKTFFKKYQNFANIASISPRELEQIRGVGRVKALLIKALFELSARVNQNQKDQVKIKGVKTLIQKSFSLIAGKQNEEFLVFFLDKQNKFISYKILYKGTKNQVLVEPTEIVREALKMDSYNIYCFHNHPSGSLVPSQEDIKVTQRIQSRCRLLGIKMVGHYIVTKSKNYHLVK